MQQQKTDGIAATSRDLGHAAIPSVWHKTKNGIAVDRRLHVKPRYRPYVLFYALLHPKSDHLWALLRSVAGEKQNSSFSKFIFVELKDET